MNENIDKKIQQLTNKMMKDSKLESPSLDFTATIMSQVDALSQSKITTYKPLISKRNWFVLGILFIVLFGLSLLQKPLETIGWFNTIDFSLFTNNKVITALSSITVSSTVVYAVAFFGLMLFIQIPFLKKHLDKQLEV